MKMNEEHMKIVPECEGCNKIDGDICTAYLYPAAKHRLCECPLKSNRILEIIKDKKINPIKASKRGGGK
jgi:hypothetical protein